MLKLPACHLCIDMQRLFAEETEWAVPWLPRVLPQIVEISRRHADRTIFTRFMPPPSAEEMPGAWRDYYRRWETFTRQRLDERLLDLVPPLSDLTPPARVVDKRFYSAFFGTPLLQILREWQVCTLVITGGETDVCVLSTLMAAIDRAFNVVLVTDAVCSSADQTHDALMTLYRSRFGNQVETMEAEQVLRYWPAINQSRIGPF